MKMNEELPVRHANTRATRTPVQFCTQKAAQAFFCDKNTPPQSSQFGFTVKRLTKQQYCTLVLYDHRKFGVQESKAFLRFRIRSYFFCVF
jgi:hypothetical protein